MLDSGDTMSRLYEILFIDESIIEQKSMMNKMILLFPINRIVTRHDRRNAFVELYNETMRQLYVVSQ